MADWIQFVGPTRSLEVFGIRLIGLNADTGKKLIFSIVLVLLVIALSRAARRVTDFLLRKHPNPRVRFWARQVVHLVSSLVLFLGLISIWFTDTSHLATFLGLFTAGLGFALQRVITAIAGYFMILRSRVFSVGDRIRMGGVRGDVISLGLIQTMIMEMGDPAAPTSNEPSMWVHARQYTGRIVAVTNDQVFSEPVYNYTRDFPYIWEEMHIPITYTADRARAERIMLDAAAHHTLSSDHMSDEAVSEMERRYRIRRADMTPRVYYRLTDNWLELTVRFMTYDYGVRDVKDAMSREIITEFDKAGIGIASGTYDIVGVPPVRVRIERDAT